MHRKSIHVTSSSDSDEGMITPINESTSSISPPAAAATSAATPTPIIDCTDPHNLRNWSYVSLYGCLMILVVSGSLKTLTTQLATNQSATRTASMILIWINYFGQYAFGVISNWINQRKQQSQTNSCQKSELSSKTSSTISSSSSFPTKPPAHPLDTTHTLLMLIAALDVIGCVVCLIATVLIGSGLYQVLYASILVMIALLSQAILGYQQNKRQWACLILATAGLWACSLVSSQTSHTISETGASVSSSAESNSTQPTSALKTIPEQLICTSYLSAFLCEYVSLHVLGIILTLLGTFIYAVQSVLCELMNTSPNLEKVSAAKLNASIGLYGLVMASVWVVFYTIPHWHELVSIPMSEHAVTFFEVFQVFVLYLVANVFHRITYWSVVEKTGSIFAGLANALRTVVVFFLSSWLFCEHHPQQCLTRNKTYAAMTVVLGVILYQLSPSNKTPVPIRVHGVHAAMLSPRSSRAISSNDHPGSKSSKSE